MCVVFVINTQLFMLVIYLQNAVLLFDWWKNIKQGKPKALFYFLVVKGVLDTRGILHHTLRSLSFGLIAR